jgi:uncharacterized protein
LHFYQLPGSLRDKVLSSLSESWWMFFDTFWALVFGFILSGVIQALVSRKAMISLMGDHRAPTIARASFFGMVSSSCSYAASALAHSIFKKGADFTASMVFMFASTNLVIELGIVLWLLLGWQFAAAEFFGGVVMILLLKISLPLLFTPKILTSITPSSSEDLFTGRDNSQFKPSTANARDLASDTADQNVGSLWWSKASASAGFTIGDLTMLRVELVIGFVVAGFATVMVPLSFWRALFISDHGIWSNLENVLIAPFLALISFVCSVGNVPLAAALWKSGITYGGVIAFIFADLISLPLLLIYRKYYGAKITIRLVAIFWLIMSASGLATEALFNALDQIPAHRSGMMSGKHFGANATTILNIIALLFLVLTYYFYKNPPREEVSDFAQDPICGMQVRKSDAPARYKREGVEYFFCMEGCKEAFVAQSAVSKD